VSVTERLVAISSVLLPDVEAAIWGYSCSKCGLV